MFQEVAGQAVDVGVPAVVDAGRQVVPGIAGPDDPGGPVIGPSAQIELHGVRRIEVPPPRLGRRVADEHGHRVAVAGVDDG